MGPARIRLDQRAPDVTSANAWLDRVTAEAGLSPDLAADIKLSVNEVIANVVEHGGPAPAGAEIALTVDVADGVATVTITDRAREFDPRQHPEPKPMESLETARIGGFGISLVRGASRRMHYAREDGTNRLTLEFGPPQDAPA